VQSHVPAHTEMQWFLSSLTPLSWLNKMIQFKEKKSANDKHSSLSLYSYPVLMAADILLYQASHVPVGEDQTQHLELSRDIAERFNRIFGDLFPQPQKLIFEDSVYQCNRVMSLSNAEKKMSKSDKSAKSIINLIDEPDIIRLKIRKAKTDSHGTISYDPIDRPELANLLRIYGALSGIPVEKVHQVFEGDNMFSFKEKLSNALIDKVCPIGEKALDLCANHEDMLLDVVDAGAKKANEAAERTLA
jgi:tryptophanyl-tRNA synthetase